jgi:CheY-like chemotaxis protein
VASSDPNDRSFPALIKVSVRVLGEAFFNCAPARVEELHKRLQAARRAAGPDDLQEFLGELFLGLHSLSLEAERAELRAVSRLISTLEGMLKKLLQNTSLCTPSALDAAAAALELLGELCDRPEANPDLARPPVRILVVDDDPVARRAISMSIQLVFGRPENAESGEAALALTSEKRFDLIFLDVLMPGIDGVETCKKIHETALNCRTPVVFVTSHDDTEARSKAALAGGCGFIPKPVVPSQIKLTALTFLLRARLKQPEPESALQEAACLEMV